jgi:hypothetical protein
MPDNKAALLVAASPLATSHMRELLQDLPVDADYSGEFEDAVDQLSHRSYQLIVLVLKQIRRSQLNSKTKVLCLRATASPVATTCDRSTKMALKILGANYFWDISSWEYQSPMQSEQRNFMVSELQALLPQGTDARQLILSKSLRAKRIEDLHDTLPKAS